MATLASVLSVTMATILSITMATAHAPKMEACKICRCSQNNRVVNCTKKNLHQGLPLIYPSNMQVLVLNRVNLSYLGKDFFANSKHLVELKIEHSHVKAIHKEAFKTLQHLEKLDLAFNKIETLPEGLFQSCPKLEYLSLQSNKLSIQAVGQVLPSSPNLQTLDIKGLPMDTDLNYTLSPGYASLTKLQNLYIEESLENLTSDFFLYLSNSSLEFLSLSKNQFSNISSFALLPLPHLKKLDFSRTNVPTAVAENLFESISRANISLDWLDLRHNFIYDEADEALDREMFRPLESVPLRVLHLESSYGGFHGVIHNKFFQYLPHLEELYLDRSEIRRIYPHVFKELHQLKTLSLAGNYLHCLKGCQFLSDEKFKNLEHLDLSDNVITDRAKDFSFDRHNFPKLQTLTVKNNRLVQIENSIFGNLRHLQKLDLSQNPLNGIDAEAFSGMPHLQQLRITDCPHLTELLPDTFSGLRAVRGLKLDNNGLETLHPGCFSGLHRLESLSLRNNKLGSDHHLPLNLSLTSANLTFLDLGHNDLDAIPISMLGNQPQLATLYLDHNRIMNLDEQIASKLDSLELLDLSYNDFMTIDKGIFDGRRFPRLHTLSLAGNPFLCTCPVAPFVESLRKSLRDPRFKLIARERHLCVGPAALQGMPLLSYDPTEWECHLKVYMIPIVVICLVLLVTCSVVCICRKRTSKDSESEEYTEQDIETREEAGHLTGQSSHVTGHMTQTNGSVVVEAQTSSSSMESSQSSITNLCVPLKNFRGTKRRKNSSHASNGNAHVLLNESDSEIEEHQETEVDEADAIV